MILSKFRLCLCIGVLFLMSSTQAASDGAKDQTSPFDLKQVIQTLIKTDPGPIETQGLDQDTIELFKKRALLYDQLYSLSFDDVTPIRAPIFISTDPSSKLTEIHLTRSRPTTIAFLDKNGKPFPITEIIQKQVSIDSAASDDSAASGKAAKPVTRFNAELLEQTSNIVKFSTSVTTGWTTVDFNFKEVPYPIPVKLIAGRTYAAGAQATVIDDRLDNMQDNSQSDKPSFGNDADLSKVLTALANYGAQTKSRDKQSDFIRSIDKTTLVGAESAKFIKLMHISTDRYTYPTVQLFHAMVNGKPYYLLRTNGSLQKPDYIMSNQSVSIGSKIWAYAIKEDDLNNIICINYGGGNHIYAVDRQNPITGN